MIADDDIAEKLSSWAKSHFQMTAMHPAGKNNNGIPKTNIWPPPEGSFQNIPTEKNPLLKLLMDVCNSQQSLLEDHLLLTNCINIHKCSAYCLTQRGKQKIYRMEFGSVKNPGKMLRDKPAIINDRNGRLRLEMERDHPFLVQHSALHTQGWRANGDISFILNKSDSDTPSLNEIIAIEKYVTGYACKRNQVIGSLVDLFKDIVDNSSDNIQSDRNSLCINF
ncbi:hypothetical protein ACF0H5_006523 [Mactra antiquata]